MIKNKFFDDLEIRSNDERISDHLKKLNKLIEKAKQNKNQSLRFNDRIKDLNEKMNEVILDYPPINLI